MTDNRIREQLTALRDEVRALDPASARARELRRHLLTDLDGFLAAPSRETHEGLTARLREGIDAFETSHPQLTVTLAQLVDQLAAWNL